MITDTYIAQLERRIAQLERSVNNLPVRFSGAAATGGLSGFRVKAVGGSNGGLLGTFVETYASWTYNVYSLDDASLAHPLYTNVSLTGNAQRLLPVEMQKANWGVGQIAAGNFFLFWVDEQSDGYFECNTDKEPSGSGSGS